MGCFWVFIAAVCSAMSFPLPDSDGDGLTDDAEASLGLDPTRCDTDEDGLGDGLESALRTPADPDNAACFVPDDDPTTSTDPARADTDGGGAEDGAEDLDLNGEIGPWESDPNESRDDADGDGDGLSDVVEARCGLAGTDDDRDADTVPDAEDGREDGDRDGLPGFCDTDDDGDGLSTASEGTGDADADGAPNYRDTDADGDGASDAAEGDEDLDCDGAPDFLDGDDIDGGCSDPDQDGLDNDEETACGSDPNAPDTDGDGRDDADEACNTDVDCDRLPDRLDAVDDPGLCAEDTPTDVYPACVTTDRYLDCGQLRGGSCSMPVDGHAGWWGALPALLLRRRRTAR